MAIDFKPNFFNGATPASQMLEIAFINDPQFRAKFGQWLYERFDGLVDEYKRHGRFLTLQEIQDSPLTFSDLP